MLASNLARRYFTPKRQLRTRAYFRKFGSKVVLVGRFTPGLRFTIFFTAGTLHVRPAIFFIYDFVAAAFSVPVLVYVAYFFGEQIDNVIKYARRTEHGILIAIVIVAAIVVIKLLRRRKRIARMARRRSSPHVNRRKPERSSASPRASRPASPRASRPASPRVSRPASPPATKARRRRESCSRRSARASSTTPIPIQRRRRWPAIKSSTNRPSSTRCCGSSTRTRS